MILSGGRFLNVVSDILQQVVHSPINKAENELFDVGREMFRQRVQPTVKQDSPAHGFWLHVHHAATGHCGGTGCLQIHWLENQVHRPAHGDNLP